MVKICSFLCYIGKKVKKRRTLPSPPPVSPDKQVQRSGLANVDGLKIPVKSDWNFGYLEQQLSDYCDNEIISLLKYGFPIESALKPGNIIPPQNHKDAKNFPDELDAYIAKQLAKGTLIGPFQTNPFECSMISPMNTRPKRDSDERRVIMDLSFPDENSVNAFIDKNRYRGKAVKLTLPGVQALAELLIKQGHGALLFKRDLSSAYKQIPVCIGDIHLLGYTHRGLYYFDITLPQGLTNSCLICQMITDMIMFIYRKFGYQGVNYLDDLGDVQRQHLAKLAFDTLGHVLEQVGAKESPPKSLPTFYMCAFLRNSHRFNQNEN